LLVTAVAGKNRVDMAAPDPLRLDGFVSADLTAGWILSDAWRVDAGVFNLGDASYFEWADVRGRAASDPLLELYRRPGRNWRLAVTASW
jgi:hemoglobin/transferrin/lactoferrin receptor protein